MRSFKFSNLIWLLLLFAALPWRVEPVSAVTYGPNPAVNYDLPNFTYSPPLRKFVDKLPLLGPAGANGLGQYIPIAVPTPVASLPAGVPADGDYYEIALVEYREQMHSDLPPVVIPVGSTLGKADPLATGGTKLRGYVQELNGTPMGEPHYLGPLIIATKDRPVRIKFTNRLPVGAAGDLFLPVDTEIMGAGAYTIDNPAVPGALISGMFTQNRATLHLHGGIPGWVSDGTAHQWISPAGEFLAGAAGANYPKGMSAQNVPDMPLPANGSMTFHWTNQQSGRLMFYHDHAYGLTGPNVYAGEAAGYLLRDPVEIALTNGTTAGIPAMDDVPLVIQDKTFVPDPATLALTDPLWDSVKWGGLGSLWMPHVYMPNQDPFNALGATPFGRWDYGPWFWPVFPASGPMPLISHIPETFMDTPLVNGTAYPYMDVVPKTYRFRILNAANDRFFNLQLYIADPLYVPAVTVPALAPLTEVRMVPALLNPAIPFPTLWQFQTPGMIPDILDSRPGGVPDPTLIGPAMIQIGTEGGLMPAPVVLPNTPVGYEQNKRNIVVGSIAEKNLLLAPAERADVIIDFSQYAGKTIILYNDSPAPVPAGDPRNDFYTGNPDNTASGGHASTLAGFGPNTRTIMQFRVAAAPVAAPFAPPTPPPAGPEATPPAALVTALAAAFTATQDAPIVNGVTSRIQDNAIPLSPQPLASITVTAPGSGYTSAPTVQFLGGLPGTGAAATATVVGGKVTAITLTNPGAGYSYPPTIMLSGGGGFGATATAVVANTVQMKPKAIQELFDPLGRMNATLGVELPFTSALTQTTIPLGFVDPVTETFAPNEIQLWKITHNGVDTHGVHFHLVNVQVINRVGWDGAIRGPDPNELGWRETVRMNPLEDIIVAAKAKPPLLPFGMPNSIRPLSVTEPLGSSFGFTQVNPATGNPMVVVNVMNNFFNEYTWHCHLLGHEENDMMRPMVLTSVAVAPGAFTLAQPASGLTLALNWVDPTPYIYTQILPPPAGNAATLGNPSNEIGFNILRAPGATGGVFTQIGTALANATSFIDPTPLAGTSRYQIVAFNSAGSTASNIVTVVPLVITTAALPNGEVGVAYSQTLAATGGSGAYTWAVTVGALPGGLTLAPATGVISGTPTTAGTFAFTVSVTDAIGGVATKALSIVVIPAVTITTATLPGGTVGVAYSQTLAATGGLLPYTWAVTVGALPGGLTLAPATGIISGTPTAAGTFSFTVRATDGLGGVATQALSIVVISAIPPVAITTALPLPGGTVAFPYSKTETATGGTLPYTWSVTAGALPGGLTLAPATGIISGTPTTAGTFNFTVMVSANGSTATQAQSIVVNPAVTVTTATLPAGSVNILYAPQTLAASGGTTPYTWTLSGGALPTGLAMSTAGVISGTPIVAGTFNFTVSVTDANLAVATRPLSITIAQTLPAAPTLLTGAISGATQIRLTWRDNSNNETSFVVYRSTNGGAFVPTTVTRSATQRLSVGGTVTYNNTVTAGNTYAYYVTAANTAGASAPTATVTVAFIAPAAPSGLTGSAVVIAGNTTADRATLNWTDNSANETGFQIQRALSTDPGFTAPNTYNVGANVTTFSQNVSKANDFIYRVRATINGLTSAWSNTVLVTTP